MLRSISSEPGILEEIFTTSCLCFFTTAVWQVWSSSLSQECSHSPLSSSVKSEIGALIMLRCLVQQPKDPALAAGNCSFRRSKLSWTRRGLTWSLAFAARNQRGASRLRCGRQKLSASGPTLFVSRRPPQPPIYFFADNAQPRKIAVCEKDAG